MKLLVLSFMLLTLPILARADMSPTPTNSMMMGGTTTHVMLAPNDMKWGPASNAFPPGMQTALLVGDPSKPGLFTMRAKLPPGYKIAAHWHSTDEHVTVLSGTMLMGAADKLSEAASKTYPTGSYVFLPAKMHHFAWTKEGATIQVSAQGPFDINYINPADDPRNQSGKTSASK